MGAVHPCDKLAGQTTQNSELWAQWDALFQYGRYRVIGNIVSTSSGFSEHTHILHTHVTIHIHILHDIHIQNQTPMKKTQCNGDLIMFCFIFICVIFFLNFFLWKRLYFHSVRTSENFWKIVLIRLYIPCYFFHHYAKQLRSSADTETAGLDQCFQSFWFTAVRFHRLWAWGSTWEQ